MFISLVWNDQQSLYPHCFDIIIIPVLFCVCQFIETHHYILTDLSRLSGGDFQELQFLQR